MSASIHKLIRRLQAALTLSACIIVEEVKNYIVLPTFGTIARAKSLQVPCDRISATAVSNAGPAACIVSRFCDVTLLKDIVLVNFMNSRALAGVTTRECNYN